MKLALLCALLAASSLARAADADAIRYTPEIFGRLAGARGYAPKNVCLRHSGSEITQCAYTNSEGRFYIPSFGEVHPDRAAGAGKKPAYPDYWLEVGTRTAAATRMYTVGLVDREGAVLQLDCDPSRPASMGAARLCEPRSTP